MTEHFQRKSFFRLTFPLFIFMLMTMGVTFVDTMLLSNYSDNLAAAVSMANQILGVAYDLSGLMSVGALVLISQYLGRDDLDAARGMAVIGILASLLLGLAIAFVLVVGGRLFAAWINTPAEIFEDVIIYVYIISGAMIFNGFITASAAVLRGFGHTLLILVLGALGNAIYIFFEYALIYGRFGFPELGIYGSGLATLVIRLLKVAVLFYVLRRILKLSFFDIPGGFWRSVKKITTIAYPSVGENMCYNVYQLTIVSMIAVLGVGSVLTRSYALTITALLLVISMVTSLGNEVLVGYDKGAEDNEAAYRRANKAALITGAVAMVAAVGLYVFAEDLIRLFTQDAEVIAGVVAVLMLQIFVTPFRTINHILFNSLKAVGDVNKPVLFNLSITFCVALPFAYVAIKHLDLGVQGVWYAYILEEALKAMAMSLRWRQRSWHGLQLIRPSPAE